MSSPARFGYLQTTLWVLAALVLAAGVVTWNDYRDYARTAATASPLTAPVTSTNPVAVTVYGTVRTVQDAPDDAKVGSTLPVLVPVDENKDVLYAAHTDTGQRHTLAGATWLLGSMFTSAGLVWCGFWWRKKTLRSGVGEERHHER